MINANKNQYFNDICLGFKNFFISSELEVIKIIEHKFQHLINSSII